MWKWIAVSLVVCVVLTGCTKDSTDTGTEDIGKEVIELLVKGDLEQVSKQFFSDDLRESMPLPDLVESWEGQTKTGGEYVGVNSLQLLKGAKSHIIVEAEVEYTEVIFQVRLTFDKKNLLVGFNIQGGIASATLPEALVEEEVLIGEGTQYELGATLTLPKSINEQVPAIVLVHGSGPSDRDESVYSYKPFRDIAWGMADQDIAVLRYDKRTYTYGSQMSEEEINKLTVHEETVEDAIKTAELLKNDPRIDPDNIFLIGHSLGGMLAPRIATESQDFAGIVSLAGSPRTLWEIIYDQNMAVLGTVMDESTREEQEDMIQEQFHIAQQIKNMTVQEALKETVFGVSAYYFQEMDRHDIEKLILELEIPILILQGEDDFQVDLIKDYGMWQELLGDRENASLISYQGLNHFFIHYEGPGKGTIAEYEHPHVVESNVIDDMVDWILDHKR